MDWKHEYKKSFSFFVVVNLRLRFFLLMVIYAVSMDGLNLCSLW